MRRVLGAAPLWLVLAPVLAPVLTLVFAPALATDASAQPARTVPPSQIAAQTAFDTASLLELYMIQLAAAGHPPSQTDIDKAARQYLTNGAAVTSVPSSGPGAAYFQNGAEVTGVPSSGPAAAYFHNGAAVMAYPAAGVAPAPSAGAVPSTEPSARSSRVTPGPAASAAEAKPATAAAIQPAPAPPVRLGGSKAGALTCPPGEIEAAMAFARQFAVAGAPSVATASAPPAPTNAPAAVPPQPFASAWPWPEPSCPPQPSLLSRLALVLGGTLFGGLVVVLWSRPRTLRGVGR